MSWRAWLDSLPAWAAAVGVGAGVAGGYALATRRTGLDRLIIDISHNDQPGPLSAVAADARFYGAILKVSEGPITYASWFPQTWKDLRAAAPDRYGASWFRGAYHFLRYQEDGATQADTFCAQLDQVGGFDVGDLMPFVDCEPEESTGLNASASAQQIIDTLSAYTARVKERTGRPVGLYTGAPFASPGGGGGPITDHCGCWRLWYPAFTSGVSEADYAAIGWTSAELFAWQYTGTGSDGAPEGSLDGYPLAIDNFGACDISAMQMDPRDACASLSFFTA